MTEEPTMAEETVEEAAQRGNAKRLAANRESKKRKRAEESQQQRENRLATNGKSMKRKRAEESQHQREIFNIDLKITEEPIMAEETAEEAAQRANAKRLAANR